MTLHPRHIALILAGAMLCAVPYCVVIASWALVEARIQKLTTHAEEHACQRGEEDGPTCLPAPSARAGQLNGGNADLAQRESLTRRGAGLTAGKTALSIACCSQVSKDWECPVEPVGSTQGESPATFDTIPPSNEWGGKRGPQRCPYGWNCKSVTAGRDRLLRLATSAAHLCGVPPALFARLVARESSWRPWVVSKSQALGLAQVKLTTAQEIRPGITREELLQPWPNLLIGACYLRKLADRRGGDWHAALLDYRLGPYRRHTTREARVYAQTILGEE